MNFHLFKQIQLNDLASTAFILITLSFLIHATNLFGRIDDLIFDTGQRLVPEAAPDDVIIIAIDQSSLSKLGRWPWTRKTHAKLLKQLFTEKPKAIGFDVIFAEPELGNADADNALASALKESNNVVLPVLLETVRANGQIVETLPIPKLMQYAADVGRVHAVLDADSIARSVHLFEGVGSPSWQLFSQAVLNVANSAPSKNDFSINTQNNNASFYTLVRKDQRRINFIGPPGHFNQISYVQVLNGEYPEGIFKNKIVLVGATALGMNDLLTTPVSGLSLPMSGVEFHANVFTSLRADKLIHVAPFWLSAIIIAMISVLPLFWMPKVSALKGFLITMFFMGSIALLTALIPKLFGVWLPPAAALTSLMLAYPIWSWRKLEAAQRFLDYEFDYLKKNLDLSVQNQNNDKGTLSYDKFDSRIAQVRMASKQLHFLNEKRKETLAFISHDLRAPIANALYILEQHQAIKDKLHQPLSQALNLAEDFLQASRAEMLDTTTFDEIDFVSLVHQAVDDAYQLAMQNEMTLIREITDDVVWVKGNFGLLHRAILNMILNAVKHSPKQTEIIVKVALEQAKKHIIFSVTDNGPGIAEADQANLFKRYSKLDGKQTFTKGAGLGLYFVNLVADKHNGVINVTSALGHGATFSLRIPIVDYVQ